jgi:hypothetical protein
MNCVTHPDLPAIAYCRTCGKALCENCQRSSQGISYCAEHVPSAAPPPPPYPAPQPSGGYSPYTSPVPPPPLGDAGASPGLAFLLGLIPGVGAIYNGQYVKGLIHVVILGVLISIVSSGEASRGFEPLFGMLTAVWVFYMAFEAYHTAKKRQMGQAVDEFSSIVPLRGEPSRFPAGPAVLIAAGLLFLLSNLGFLRFGDILRYWPIALIALGAYLLYERLSPARASLPSAPQEATHERR